MSDTDPTTDPVTEASMANAAQNASFPATAGDVDRSTGLPADQSPATAENLGAGEPTADSTVDDVVAYLQADVDADERARRVDFVQQLEDGRDGDNRKGVTAALDAARQA
jgi:hypothetical protein